MITANLPRWARPKDMLDLIRLAIPVALSRASFMLMSLTDAVVLARHRPGELPYVLNGWLPIGVLFGFGMGLMLGVQVVTSELSGQGEASETGRVYRRGLAVALIYGLFATVVCLMVARPLLELVGFQAELTQATTRVTCIFAYGAVAHMVGLACSSYLEALRKPNIVTAISLAAVIVNLIVDLVLVPKFGAIGVAWATTGSRYFMMVCFLVAVAWLTPGWKRSARGPVGEFRRQNMVGIGTGVANIAEWGSFNLTFVIATLVSIDAGTVYGLTVQMMGVVFMIYVGLGTATSVRVAERFGRQDAAGVQEASRLGIAAAVAMGGVLALLLWMARDAIAVIWLNGADPASAGARLVPTLAAMVAASAVVTIFDGLQGVGSMAQRAQGQVWTATAIHIGSYILVMLPLCWWLALHEGRGVWGVFIGIAVASVLAGLGQCAALEWKAARSVRIARSLRAA